MEIPVERAEWTPLLLLNDVIDKNRFSSLTKLINKIGFIVTPFCDIFKLLFEFIMGKLFFGKYTEVLPWQPLLVSE